MTGGNKRLVLIIVSPRFLPSNQSNKNNHSIDGRTFPPTNGLLNLTKWVQKAIHLFELNDTSNAFVRAY